MIRTQKKIIATTLFTIAVFLFVITLPLLLGGLAGSSTRALILGLLSVAVVFVLIRTGFPYSEGQEGRAEQALHQPNLFSPYIFGLAYL